MSLAADIARQLNGHRSGGGWVVPAICHSPDSRKRNLLISDGYNGKLSAKCFSNDCGWQIIMQALESCGAKPQDIYTPKARQKQRLLNSKRSRNELIKTMQLEMFVLTKHFDTRLEDFYRSQDRDYLKLHPEFKKQPDEFWEREIQALERIRHLCGELL